MTEQRNSAANEDVAGEVVTSEQLATRLTAIASTQRLTILAAIIAAPLHVSELARRVEMSRALLYMHLRKLEEAGFVTSRRELGDDGRAINVYSLTPFSLTITPEVIVDAVAATPESEN